MALIVQALRNEQQRHRNERNPNLDCLSLQTSFLSSTAADTSCDIAVQVIKRGRKISWLRADMLQSEKVRATAVAAFGTYDLAPTENIVPSEEVNAMNFESERWKSSAVTKLISPLGNLPLRYQWRFAPQDEETYAHMTSLKLKKDKCPTNYFVYMRHEDSTEPITVESLVAMADATVPTVKGLFSNGHSHWVPTLSFDTQIFAQPRADLEWVLCEFSLVATSPGRCTQRTSIYDPETGALLCRSTQGALNEAPQQDKSKM